MSLSGWFKTYRRWQNGAWSFRERSILLELYGQAEHEDTDQLRRGEVLVNLAELARVTDLTRKQLRNAIGRFIQGAIIRETGRASRGVVYLFVRYGEPDALIPEWATKRASEGPQSGPPPIIRGEGRNGAAAPAGQISLLDLPDTIHPATQPSRLALLPGPTFQDFRAKYPARKGKHEWAEAERRWDQLIMGGIRAQDIMDGLERYKEHLHDENAIGTRWVMQAVTFLSPKKKAWTEDYGVGDLDAPSPLAPAPDA